MALQRLRNGEDYDIRRLHMKKVLEIAAGAAKKVAGTALALVGKGFSLCLSAVRHTAAAARHLTAKVTGKAAHCGGGKIKKVAAPALKGVMIASAAVTVLSCVGWLVARRD